MLLAVILISYYPISIIDAVPYSVNLIESKSNQLNNFDPSIRFALYTRAYPS